MFSQLLKDKIIDYFWEDKWNCPNETKSMNCSMEKIHSLRKEIEHLQMMWCLGHNLRLEKRKAYLSKKYKNWKEDQYQEKLDYYVNNKVELIVSDLKLGIDNHNLEIFLSTSVIENTIKELEEILHRDLFYLEKLDYPSYKIVFDMSINFEIIDFQETNMFSQLLKKKIKKYHEKSLWTTLNLRTKEDRLLKILELKKDILFFRERKYLRRNRRKWKKKSYREKLYLYLSHKYNVHVGELDGGEILIDNWNDQKLSIRGPHLYITGNIAGLADMDSILGCRGSGIDGGCGRIYNMSNQT